MVRASRRCPEPGCPELGTGGRCAAHASVDRVRGSPAARGYGRTHRDRFRVGVLVRDRTCVICLAAPATVADHWPRSRRELVVAGLDPDDPQYGRGLCASCHGKATAANPDQVGGWNAR